MQSGATESSSPQDVIPGKFFGRRRANRWHGPNRVSERIHKIASGRCPACKTAKPHSVHEVLTRLKDLPGSSFAASSIRKEFRFSSYLSGLEFACALGRIA